MSQQISTFPDLDADMIPDGVLAYIGQRAKNAYYHYVMGKFRECGMSQAKLARRIGKSPAQMNRMLSSPGNWTIETSAVLLAGICGEEVTPASRPFAGRAARNGAHHAMIDSEGAILISASPSRGDVSFVDLKMRDIAS